MHGGFQGKTSVISAHPRGGSSSSSRGGGRFSRDHNIRALSLDTVIARRKEHPFISYFLSVKSASSAAVGCKLTANRNGRVAATLSILRKRKLFVLAGIESEPRLKSFSKTSTLKSNRIRSARQVAESSERVLGPQTKYFANIFSLPLPHDTTQARAG